MNDANLWLDVMTGVLFLWFAGQFIVRLIRGKQIIVTGAVIAALLGGVLIRLLVYHHL
jgi:hypothetical protein